MPLLVVGKKSNMKSSFMANNPQFENKYRFEPVSSPINPERAGVAKVRVERGPCCLCGTVGDWKGLDAYAKVAFYFQVSARRASGGTIDWNYERYIGSLRVLFCEKCVPQSVAEKWHNSLQREGLRWAIAIPFLAIGLSACLWFGDNQGRGSDASNLQIVIGLILGVGFLSAIVLFNKNTVKYSPELPEFSFYVMRVGKFLDDEKDKLIAACDLSGSELKGIDGVEDAIPTAKNVRFDIEPHQFNVAISEHGKSNLAKGSNGVEWKACGFGFPFGYRPNSNAGIAEHNSGANVGN